jgi:hypothetical protein
MIIGSLWFFDTLLAFVSSLILFYVLSFYIRSNRLLSSRFTMALLLFSALLLIQNVAAIGVYMLLSQKYAADVALPLTFLQTIETFGIGTLAWLVRQ